jgi:two-component system alkaline phosphatase synthesis response regulator PhoP
MNVKRKILIVDDEPDIIEFLSYNFRKKGYEVVTANNGSNGIKSALSELPDIIISDILMPEMNGITMCRNLRILPGFDKIPVIFLSAVNDDYRVLSAMDAGADHYVSKPIRIEILGNMVEELLSGK